ncbi:MAG TPA: ABC transporter permease [Gammaproteobacteria bacterium]|nr:ABC transporter permease [Gammaproteobacteria bacterium]
MSLTVQADIAADIRYALRGFKRTPGLTLITVLTLAVGLGATAAIFSVVNAVLLRPLPYAEPERLVQVVENVPAAEGFGGVAQRRSAMNATDFEFWRQNTSTLSHVAMLSREGRVLSTDDGSVQLYGQRVSPALFAMRGVQPLLGRGLVAEDETPDNDVVVLADATWRQYFNSAPDILERRIELDGRALTVVGVMPPAFGEDAFWVPFIVPPPGPGVFFSQAEARLADGVSLEAASAEANTLGLQMRGITPEPDAEPRFEVVRSLDQLTVAVAPALRVLVVAVGVVLAIVCTNVANLLLVRGTRRQQEIAIRRSIGATRGRIVRQVLTESLVLAGFSALVAIAFAFAGVALLKLTASSYVNPRFPFAGAVLPRLNDIAVDPTVLAFVVGLALVTGLLFGLLPALRLSKYGERGHASESQLSAMARNSRLGQVLATVQLACAMALLIGAGLLVGSFMKLTGIDSGFDARGVLSFAVVVPGDTTADRKLEIAETLAARLTDDTRVTSAGFADVPPLTPGIMLMMGNFVPQSMPAAQVAEEQRSLTPEQRTQTRQTSPAYLRALGARLVAGTWLDERASTEPAVLVTRAYADQYFPNGDAVGATLAAGFGSNTVTVAGVVDDVHLGGLERTPERAVFMDPRLQLTAQRAMVPRPPPQMERNFLTLGGSSITFAARTTGDPLAIMPDLRRIARDIDPRLAIDAAAPMEQVISSLTTRPRFYAVLLGTFGAIAAFIAVIGLYGLLSYVVGQRTKEIGIRMALGAQRDAVLKLVLRQGGAMVAIGLIAGVAGAATLTRYLQGMLFGLEALDPLTFAVVALAFAAVAMVAAYLPARRATTIDPLVAVRYE